MCVLVVSARVRVSLAILVWVFGFGGRALVI